MAARQTQQGKTYQFKLVLLGKTNTIIYQRYICKLFNS